ncbi:hypothetical protein [Euhalothece natronophila]|nr:hypothetical protein [Euhalothece natronophila]
MAYYWRIAKPFSIPQTPNWFRPWFILVQVLGVLFPLIALILWGIWWRNTIVLFIFASYFLILGLQILTETIMLRQFQTVAWVAIPYFYVPYRVWQLYQGLITIGDIVIPNKKQQPKSSGSILLPSSSQDGCTTELNWNDYNYCLNLLQLPLLFRWEKE